MTTGETEAIVAPMRNLEVMKEQLRLISQSTPTGKYAVVLVGIKVILPDEA